ncbi:MAG: aminotransferase class V-fold PLP-dependent enzyme [bacterium]|nr:aminotransferase class V-fold PLP-dependent enzyme [bacterium]
MRELYLNHAGTSWPKPVAVMEAVQEYMNLSPGEWPERFEAAHVATARFFGIDQPDQLLLTPGCTSALAVGISDFPLVRGKRILTSSWEHHALFRPLHKLAERGVRVERVPPEARRESPDLAGPMDLEWLENELSKGDVALIAVTAACNVTGQLLPCQEVIALAKQFGVSTCLDAAQVVGWQRLDLPKLGADIVAFGGHKGLQAPWGIGGLYLADDLSMSCTSAVCELPTAGMTANPRSRPGYCDAGSVDQLALAGLHTALPILAQRDPAADVRRARAQIRRLRALLESMEGVRIYASAESEPAIPTLAFHLRGKTSTQTAVELRRRGLLLGSGLHCAPLVHETLGTQDTGLVRLSVGIGQADEEIDSAVEILRDTLTR